MAQHRAGRTAGGLVLTVQRDLRQLDVPVAELAPREVVDLLRGEAEVVVLKVCADLADRLVKPRENPLVRQPKLVRYKVQQLLLSGSDFFLLVFRLFLRLFHLFRLLQ